MLTFPIVFFKYSECDIAGSSRNIKNPDLRLFLSMSVHSRWCEIAEFFDKAVLPIAVNAHGHEVIHDIVLVGDGVEDLVDQGLLLISGDGGETKVVIVFRRRE
jgi:hypothetical protein